MILPYALPRAFESEELTTRLMRLSPLQRRVLREYVEKVEIGESSIMEWLADPGCPVSEGVWYRRGATAHYKHSPLFQEALTAYLKAAIRAGSEEETKAISAAKRRLRLKADRAAERIADQVDGDIGQFFQVVERWVENPAASQKVLGVEDREFTDAHGQTRTGKFFLVQQAALDVSRLTDPRLSRMVKKFRDGPKGLEIEMYDAQRAAESILDRADLETASKGQETVELGARFEEALRRAYGEPQEGQDEQG